jgi:ubiquinone/menaquinone biosynthesis C-methylase UbiE
LAERVRAGTQATPQTTPRTAVVWSVLLAEIERRTAGDPRAIVSVLDLGGGSGVFAVPLAELGHSVTVVDTSPDALATLERRAAEAGVGDRIAAIPGDVDRLPAGVDNAGYDLVLCHGLLELVDDPATTLRTVARATRAGGCASILVATRAATVFARALGGHLADALRALTDPDGRWSGTDSVRRRFDTEAIRRLVAEAGLAVESVHGVRVVADLIPGALLDGVPGVGEALRELEQTASTIPPYRDLATQLHVLARLPDGHGSPGTA